MPYTFDMTEARIIADIYDRAPVIDPAALPAYRQFICEIDAQYAALPVRVEVVPFNPYPTRHEMFADVDRGRLQIMATGATPGDDGHPVLDNAANDRFRAVHDFYGHYCAGTGFDRDGEFAAWIRHSRLFGAIARGPMTTDLRAQNSYQIVRGEFAAQKAFILPAQYVTLPASVR